MKLRNKESGKILDAYPIINICDGITSICYTSIEELTDEWEDYEPKEPLLKGYPNEMDAIRAYGCSPLTFHRHARKGYSTFQFCFDYICFNRLFENLKDGETYTIAELCGEPVERDFEETRPTGGEE